MSGHSLTVILCLIFGYLLGSIPVSVLVARRILGVDLHGRGVRNPGPTILFRNVGKSVGIGVALADAAKGAVPVAVGLAFGLSPFEAIWPGVAAIVGHDFSIFLGFQGGKGAATTLGFLGGFILPELLVVLGTWMALWFTVRRYRFLASVFALSLTPLWVGVFRWSWPIRLGDPRWMAWVSLGLILLLWLRIFPGLLERTRHA